MDLERQKALSHDNNGRPRSFDFMSKFWRKSECYSMTLISKQLPAHISY